VRHRFLKSLLPSCLALLGAQMAAAETDPCTAPSPECAVVGRWEIGASLGVGKRSNPVEGKADIPLVVVPHISWYGKRFFLENLEVGYTLHDGEANTFNLIAAPGYDRVFFYRNDLQNIFVAGVPFGTTDTAYGAPIPPSGREFEVKDRHTTYLAGPEWTFQYGRVTGQVNALREFTGRHHGTEVRAALAASLFESPRMGSLVAGAGLTWKSSEVVHYYYGVDGLYEPRSAMNPFVKLRYSLRLSDRWSINALAHYERLGSAISRSPIIVDDHVSTVFAGVVFRIH
jgi:outer membrane protein